MNKYAVPPIVKTYLRAAAAAVAALFLADPNRPLRDYAAAGLAAVLGPIIKAIDPGETQFGKGSDTYEADKNLAE
jgi:hypothetical protein